jgi:glycosyltransferase involved in cell wall biosynthesis
MDLSNRYIFILGSAEYESEIESTTVTLAKHFAKENQVFYIENPKTWKDLIWPEQKANPSETHVSSADNLEDTPIPNLKVLKIPRLISVNFLPEGFLYRSILKINEWIMMRRIKSVIKKFKIEDYIFINSYNYYYPDIGQMLSPDINIYHCVDPLVHAVDRRHGVKSEAKLVKESDLVVCTSKQLYREKLPLNRNTFFIPNAADINHSSRALAPDLPVHDLVANIRKPIAGYFGNIERRLDYELLDRVTKANPDVSFVFAGPMSKEFVPAWFFTRSNVYHIGRVPYDAMPNVLKGFNVAMIPFKRDAVSATIFPLKLFEYLGAGKPVVATDFNPDLEEFTGSTVKYCNDATSFSEALRNEIVNDSDAFKERRRAVAAENTWEKRSNEFGAMVARQLEEQKTAKEFSVQYTI